MLESPQLKVDKKDFYRALYRLSVQEGEDFNIIRSYFISESTRIEGLNRNAQGEVVFRWNQGALQVLYDFLDMIKDSRDVLEKLESNEK